MLESKRLLEVRPSWWNFFWWLLLAFLAIPAAIALAVLHRDPALWKYAWVVFVLWFFLPLIVVAIKRLSFSITVYEDQIVTCKGLLNKKENNISCADIRAIESDQSFIQRLLDVGTIRIGTAGTDGWEEEADGIPDPDGLKELILQQKRIQIEKRKQEHHDGE